MHVHTCPSSHSCTTTSHYVVATGKEVAEVDDLANDGEEDSDEEGGEEDDSEVSRDAHPTLIRSRPFLAFSADGGRSGRTSIIRLLPFLASVSVESCSEFSNCA